jgi:ribonuclease G
MTTVHELLIQVGAGETRVALVSDGRLQGFWHEPMIGGDEARPGDVYRGRVAKVIPAMQAAFVDLGLKQDGFLSLRDAPALHEGQVIVVAVTRAADGTKGPKLTARVSPEDEARRGGTPARLRAGPGIIRQALKAAPASAAIVTDDAATAEAARKALPQRPVMLVRDDLFARHDVEDQVAALYRPRVALPGGGWITIQGTEGMTAIDVNSGGFSASGSRQETARAVNLEAAREIGRQLRLRGIGGLVVIDFIQTDDGGPVAAALKQEMGDDSRVSPMSDFGIVAIARRRTGAALGGRQACRCCGGSGQTVTPAAAAMEILRQVERSARAAPGREIVVRAGAAVHDWLTAHGADVRAGLDRRGVGRVRLIAEEREDFDVETA